MQPELIDEGISFRPLAATDLPTVASWLAQPHVREWWRAPADREAVEAKYRPRITGDEPTEVFVLRVGDRDVGIIQRYRLRDHGDWERTVRGSQLSFPNAAGIDYFIGEPDMIGRGVGSRAIIAFADEVFRRYTDVDCIVVTPQAANRASCRALERAGFALRWTGRLESDDPSDAGTAALYVLHA